MTPDIGYISLSGKDNPRVKELVRLHKERGNKVFIEGTRLCEDALESGVAVDKLIYTEDRKELVSSWYGLFECLNDSCEYLLVTDDIFRKVSSTVNPQGVAMVVSEPDIYCQERLELPVDGSDKDIYMVAEAVQDPGNLGTMIRTADAFAFSAVILLPGTCDPFSDKVLRASMGSVWHIPIVRCSNTDDLFLYFSEHGIKSYAMHLNGVELNEEELELPAAYLIGNEGNGLTQDTALRCDRLLKIPMPGKAESLNAAAAASIMGYVFANKR
ncbi:MAG: RNA methyltransferase [Clostridiales bacterium]|nr:RNA methyltransferase [Clostridiales bacterium]